jgi:opacity protein-like surface antigen
MFDHATMKQEMTMKLDWNLIGAATFGMLAQQALPAAAQAEDGRAGPNEIGVYAGQLVGDDVEGIATAAGTPELDDDVAYGVRYGRAFTDTWSLELSLGHSPTSVTRLAGPDVDLDLTTLDADAVWHFAGSARWDPFVAFGVGYAWADLDEPLAGVVDTRPAVIDDDENFTLNAAIGTKYFATERVVVHLEARYRYFDRLLEPVDASLETFEPTVAVGWRF